MLFSLLIGQGKHARHYNINFLFEVEVILLSFLFSVSGSLWYMFMFVSVVIFH